MSSFRLAVNRDHLHTRSIVGKSMYIEELILELQKLDHVFIFVTGGVCSSLGKGVLISSLATLLRSKETDINMIKCDPYFNIDPGTMSPLVHGEVFVTQDGAETDLDLGHYERVLDIALTRDSSITSGQIFKSVIEGEREGDFLGRDIQLVPHMVDAIKKRFAEFALKRTHFYTLIEIGGTVGDSEADIFLEAIRQLRWQLGAKKVVLCHLTLVPYLAWAHEIKTKPTQQSMVMLRRAGLQPDFLFLRLENGIDNKIITKLAAQCSIDAEHIIQIPTCTPTYKLLPELAKQNVAQKIQSQIDIPTQKPNLSAWNKLIFAIEKRKDPLMIGLIAKYVGSNDPYMSVIEAIRTACWAYDRHPEIITINAEKLEQRNQDELALLAHCQGIVIPGGFDARGVEGKILATQWARINKIPCLGLCLGLQVILIEYARNVLGLTDASSTEFDLNTPHPVISLLDEQSSINQRGGTMRLGSYLCTLVPQSKAFQAYKSVAVQERHRHRYEFNNAYRTAFEKHGVLFSGIYKEKNLVEIAEIVAHPFMLGTQFHPEFQSRALKPHPLFKALVEVSILQHLKRNDTIQRVIKNSLYANKRNI